MTHLWLTFVQGSRHMTQVWLEKDHTGIHHLEGSIPVATATIEYWLDRCIHGKDWEHPLPTAVENWLNFMCESGTECHISPTLTPAVAGLTIIEKSSSHYKLLWQDCSTCVQHTKKCKDWLWQTSITFHVSWSMFLEDSLTNGLYAEFWWTMARLFGVPIVAVNVLMESGYVK